jgi:hypothetical protein
MSSGIWRDVIAAVDASAFEIRYRIKPMHEPDPGAWCRWLIIPVEGYLETGSTGPVPMQDVEWIDVDPAVVSAKGRLIPARQVDASDAIVRALGKTRAAIEIVDGLVRVRTRK